MVKRFVMSFGLLASQLVLEGEMPPQTYARLHPGAALTGTERQQLADGRRQSLGAP